MNEISTYQIEDNFNTGHLDSINLSTGKQILKKTSKNIVDKVAKKGKKVSKKRVVKPVKDFRKGD